MAQAGYTPIQLYYSTTASAAPSSGNLANGELAINITDGKLYYKDNGGTVRVLAGTGGTGVVAGSNTQVQFNNNGVFGASANLTWNGSTLSTQNISLTGNLAQGTVSSAWSGYTAIDLPNAGYVSSGNSYLSMLMNAYYNGSSYVRKGTGTATELLLQGLGFTFNAAASSTAGTLFSYSTIGYLQTANVATGQTTLCLQNQASASNIILSTTSGGVSNANIEYRANAHSFQIGTSEKLGVLNGGNIGIRTTNVIGAGNIFLDGSSSAAGYFEPYNSVDGNTSIVNTGAYNILFKTNNTTKGLFTANGKFLVGTTTERNALTVVSGVSAAPPTLGVASGSAFFGSSNVLYGLLLGSDPSGPSWIQAQRVDGTAEAYDLWLQPSGGKVTVGYASNPGPTKFAVGTAPSSGSYDGLNVLRAANGVTVVGLWQTGSTYTYGSVGPNASWIYSNYGNLNITTDVGDMFFSTGVGSGITNRLKISQGGVTTVLAGAGGEFDSTASGLQLSDFGGSSYISALSGSSSRNLFIKGESIDFWTGTTYATKMKLFSNGCLSIGGTVQNPGARLVLNGETNYNDSTPGTAIGTMHFAGQLSAGFSNAITWNGGTGSTGAQAGIYVQGSGAYGTKMRFATTDSYAIGAQTRMTIDQLGNIGAPSGTNIYNASDRRLKQNIQPITNALATIKALQSVAYNWIDGFCDAEEGKTLYGWVAQDTQVVDPNLVEAFGVNDIVVRGKTIERPLRVNEKFVVPLLAQALKELTEQFEAYVAAHP